MITSLLDYVNSVNEVNNQKRFSLHLSEKCSGYQVRHSLRTWEPEEKRKGWSTTDRFIALLAQSIKHFDTLLSALCSQGPLFSSSRVLYYIHDQSDTTQRFSIIFRGHPSLSHMATTFSADLTWKWARLNCEVTTIYVTLRQPVICRRNLIPTQHSEPQDPTVLVNVLVCYLWKPLIAQSLHNPACFWLSIGWDVNAAFKGLRASLVPAISGLIRISGRACVLWLYQ